MLIEDYLLEFEKCVILKGVKQGIIGAPTMVPTRPGKLAKTKFGRKLGEVILSSDVLSVDYYGHIRKSIGFIKTVSEAKEQLRMMEAIMVHFAALKVEDIDKIAPEMCAGFASFKKKLLVARGFWKGK